MKRIISVLVIFFIGIECFSQTIIDAEKEKLTSIKIGSGKNEIIYETAGNDGYLPVGIAISDKGTLYIASDIYDENYIRKLYAFKDNAIVTVENKDNRVFINPVNQNGYTLDQILYFWNNDSYTHVNTKPYMQHLNGASKTYYLPKGILCARQSSNMKHRNFVALEICDGIIEKSFTDIDEINKWLEKQPGSFSIDTTNKILMKNGYQYSSYSNESSGSYNGKLRTYHNILNRKNKGIDITNSNGNIELHIDLPWAETNKYCMGIGNWGELYFLIIPELEVTGELCTHAKEGSEAELVVVRNHLKYFGVLTDDRIRLRSGPTTTSESLGTYPINTGFMILEKGTKQETIGGDTGVWYKVRLLDGKEGWFFGAYVRDLYDGPGTPLPWPNVADWK